MLASKIPLQHPQLYIQCNQPITAFRAESTSLALLLIECGCTLAISSLNDLLNIPIGSVQPTKLFSLYSEYFQFQ